MPVVKIDRYNNLGFDIPITKDGDNYTYGPHEDTTGLTTTTLVNYDGICPSYKAQYVASRASQSEGSGDDAAYKIIMAYTVLYPKESIVRDIEVTPYLDRVSFYGFSPNIAAWKPTTVPDFNINFRRKIAAIAAAVEGDVVNIVTFPRPMISVDVNGTSFYPLIHFCGLGIKIGSVIHAAFDFDITSDTVTCQNSANRQAFHNIFGVTIAVGDDAYTFAVEAPMSIDIAGYCKSHAV